MPALTWFVTNAIAAGVHQQMSEVSPGADATTAPNYGWTVGIIAAANFASADAGTEVPAASFGAAVQPDGTIVTTPGAGDCWRSENAYSGSFAAGAWTFQMGVIAVSNGGTQDGRAGFRLFHGPNADGAAAVEVTGAPQVGSVVTNLTTAAQQLSSIAPALAGFVVVNEFIFIQIGWEITGVGGMAAADVIHRIGTTASLVTSPDFTPAAAAARGWLLRGCD